ncbi:hypothetical protein SAMN05192584_10471 [Streptomyces pini]|uniref:Uncharacterized protein n=1 Tax=Streptomyces pini TaxID=1520580 RepID=A0A1I3X8Q9_9ACTN|nr:hypothetical protein SAMN05192584_10471 [Streptomyces pini]
MSNRTLRLLLLCAVALHGLALLLYVARNHWI